MRSASYPRLEPASQQDIILIEESVVEESDPLHEGAETSTLRYIGAHFPYCRPWKPNRTIEFTQATGTTSWTTTDLIATCLHERFSVIAGVDDIYVRRDSDFCRVWTVIPDMNRDLEDQIYAAELEIMDRFPNTRFDFTVIFSQGKDLASIQPSGAFLIHPSGAFPFHAPQ